MIDESAPRQKVSHTPFLSESDSSSTGDKLDFRLRLVYLPPLSSSRSTLSLPPRVFRPLASQSSLLFTIDSSTMFALTTSAATLVPVKVTSGFHKAAKPRAGFVVTAVSDTSIRTEPEAVSSLRRPARPIPGRIAR